MKDRLVEGLRLLYFLRFQILSVLLLIALPWVAMHREAVAMLGGLIVIEDLFALMAVVGVALLTAWTVMATTVLTWAYSPYQLDLRGALMPRWLLRWRLPAFALVAVPLVATVVRLSPLSALAKTLALVAGALAALSILAIASLIRRFVVPPEAQAEVLDLFFGHSGWIPASVRQADPGMRLRAAQPAVWVIGVVRRVFAWLGPGYVDANTGRIRSGHVAALVFFAVVLGVYAAGYYYLMPSRQPVVRPTALAYVLVLILLTTWALTALAFVLDRLRVPVLLFVIVGAAAIYELGDSDHYFLISPATRATTPTPVADVLDGAARDDVVVVAAAGGGIQAAAWTATVLTGLERELGPDFARAIRVISGVSGGAVGAMYFADRYTREGPPAAASLAGIVEAASASSLDAVAWGVAYPDLLRIVWPLPTVWKKLDRAWALEQSWRKQLSNPDATLLDWGDGVCEGWRPGVIFNATMAEQGKRLLLTSIDVPDALKAERFFGYYPDADVRVVRAARLAATFPYVTPGARADWTRRAARRDPARALPGDHVNDGGYYDNFGVASLLDWLTAAGRAARPAPLRVLMVEIAASPYTTGTPPSPVKGSSGWISATLGPAITLLNARNATQSARNDFEVAQLKELWQRRGLALETVRFAPTQTGPLSWHLTAGQRADVAAAWQYALRTEDMQRARDWWSARRPAGPGPRPRPAC